MTKKTFFKVISTVLAVAMCLTVVFTGAVSATTQNATCVVTGRAYNPGNTDYYVADVAITSTSAFVAGSFTVTCDSGLVFLDASAAQSDSGSLPKVYMNISNNKVLFAGFTESATNDIVSFTSLSLVLKFTVASGAIGDVAAGTSWNVGIENVDITNVDEDQYNLTEASVLASTIHVHNFNGDVSEEGGIRTTHCSVEGCSDVKTEVIGTSLEPNALASKDNRAVCVSFTADGDTVLNALVKKSAVDTYGVSNVYFTYTYKDDDATPKTATSKAKANTVTVGGNAYYVFPCGRNGGIGRINRPVTGNFITVVGGTTTVSGDWSYSIKDYAAELIARGKDAEEDSAEYKAANYAKALWNYGYQTAVALNHPDDYNSYVPAGEDEAAPYAIDNYTLPDSKNAIKDPSDSGNWTITGIKVTTGFKPKMTVRFADSLSTNFSYRSVTIQVKNGDDLVYSKEVAVASVVANSYTYTISDIPAKYLINDIIIGVKNSSDVADSMTIKYGFARYAQARASKADGVVFQAMMNYSYYLNEAY